MSDDKYLGSAIIGPDGDDTYGKGADDARTDAPVDRVTATGDKRDLCAECGYPRSDWRHGNIASFKSHPFREPSLGLRSQPRSANMGLSSDAYFAVLKEEREKGADADAPAELEKAKVAK